MIGISATPNTYTTTAIYPRCIIWNTSPQAHELPTRVAPSAGNYDEYLLSSTAAAPLRSDGRIISPNIATADVINGNTNHILFNHNLQVFN